VSESLSTQCIHNSIGSALSLLDISIISDTFQIGVQPVYITSALFATFTKVPQVIVGRKELSENVSEDS